MFKIKMAKTLEAAKSLFGKFHGPIVSVEAEYGSEVVQGTHFTMAHHVKGWATAPSLCENDILGDIDMADEETILISHIDLDTICGIMSVIGAYDIDYFIKKGVNYVDCNGQHNLYSEEVSEEARRFILSYIGYASKFRAPHSEEKIVDVTEYIYKLIEEFQAPEFYELGKDLVESRTAAATNYIAGAIGNIVLLNQPAESILFGLNSEYRLNGKEYDYVIVFNEKFKSITISSRLGSKGDKDMVSLMKTVFGEGAGGHFGIAGTPRGGVYNLADAANLLEVVASSL